MINYKVYGKALPYMVLIFSHSYMDSANDTRKMHRIITSEDVIEYPMQVNSKDIQFVKEEDIEYRDGKLVKSNGSTILSLNQEHVPQEGSEGYFVDIFTVSGSFSMELSVCRPAPRTTRKRRNSVQRNLQSAHSLEETLMASFDQGISIKCISMLYPI